MEFFARLAEALLTLHPPHTMLVHFPIALSTSALVLVLLARWRRSDSLEKASYYNMVLAVIGGARLVAPHSRRLHHPASSSDRGK